MNAVLQYQQDWDDRMRLQVALLREGRPTEADLKTIAEELEEKVQSDEAALVSYLKQVMIHLCKLRYLANQLPAQHWRREIANFRSEIDEKCLNAYSNSTRQQAMRVRAWKGARKVLQHTLAPDEARSLPAECPFQWAQLRDDEYFG